MKVMGLTAGVEVEPDSQTKIIDDGVSQPGVIIGSVPGGFQKLNLAGGYDAIYFLTIGRIARNRLCDYLTLKYRLTPLLAEESSSGLKIEDSSFLYLAN